MFDKSNYFIKGCNRVLSNKGSRSSTPHERSTPNTGRNAPNPAAIQQLQFQQQQLISQLQLVQQKILMVSDYIEANIWLL